MRARSVRVCRSAQRLRRWLLASRADGHHAHSPTVPVFAKQRRQGRSTEPAKAATSSPPLADCAAPGRHFGQCPLMPRVVVETAVYLGHPISSSLPGGRARCRGLDTRDGLPRLAGRESPQAASCFAGGEVSSPRWSAPSGWCRLPTAVGELFSNGLYGTSTILPRVCRRIRSRYAVRTSTSG